MVVRRDRARVITLFWDSISEGSLTLDEARAQHARVRRAAVGDAVRLVDGKGTEAHGTVEALEKRSLVVDVHRVTRIRRPPRLDVIVPVADRDRMLTAAEKCVELQVTAWRPAYFERSRSVSPRGEGAKFGEKVIARMESALEQSSGAWLPAMHPEVEFERILEDADLSSCVLLDASGDSLPPAEWASVPAFAVGPEGGISSEELGRARERGWRIARLGASTLRFETAIIAGAAVIRAAQLSARST